jgi:hypothetical protein
MEMYTQVPQREYVEPPEDISETTPSTAPRHDADVARSENNVLRWRAYLPEDCVRMMILQAAQS